MFEIVSLVAHSIFVQLLSKKGSWGTNLTVRIKAKYIAKTFTRKTNMAIKEFYNGDSFMAMHVAKVHEKTNPLSKITTD